MRALGLFMALLLAAAGAAAQGSPGQIDIGQDDRYVLSQAFTVLEDERRQLTLEDVLQSETQKRFRPMAQFGPGANFGYTTSAFWLRVVLNSSDSAPSEWLFEISYPPLDRFELYSPDAASGFRKQVGGDTYPFAQRIIAHRNHVLPVRLTPGQANVLYLRIESEGTLAAPSTLWQPQALWQHDLASYATLSLYFGLLVGLLLYNLLLFVSVRERAYLIYAAFVAWMGIGQAAQTGLGAQYLWSGWTWWNTVSMPVALATAAAFGVQFARSLLSTRQRLPAIDRLLLIEMAGWALSILVTAALSYRIGTQMATSMGVVTVVTMVVVGVISVRREFAGARYFFMAWALLLVGALILTLHNIALLPSNAITANGLLIGSAIEMVLLSFALGDRINVARRFKEQAQARIAAEHAMVEALEESQDRLRRVLEEREVILQNSIVGIAFLTPAGRFRWANKAMLDIFGAQAQAGASMEPLYTSREQYLAVGNEVAEAVSRGEVYETELQVRRADGAPIWVLLSGKAVSPDDLTQGTVWVVMNITQRKFLEEQLRKNNSEREAILNNAVVGIVLSVHRRHEWVNEKFAQMLGYPRQILIGQSSMYIHPDIESWERFGVEARAELIETGSYICERQLKRRNGELLWVEMGGSCVLPNDPDSGVIWTFLDITQRKKSEIEIREALEQQKALNELRSRFVAMTSHELRTPLAQILSAEQLLRHYGERLLQDERAEVLDSIAAGVQRMSRMMDRVLLLGKADAGMLDFHPQRMHLSALCRQLVEEAHAQQPGDLSEVVLEVDEDLGEGDYDEKLLRHIFGNLLSNALKYSPAGGQVRFTARREGSSTVFEVRDRGIGIPSDELGDLFESFHRASNVGTIQGTGLGLAIVRTAVEKHGGTIGVESTLGQGTTFRVTLPS